MVKRSTLAVSLVVVLVLLSGCSAVLDGGSGDGNGAGTEAPDSAEEFDYADGFGPNGITDGQQALESYQSAVEARGSYASTYGFDVRANDGNTSLDVENRVDVENQQGYQRVDIDFPEYAGESTSTRWYPCWFSKSTRFSTSREVFPSFARTSKLWVLA